MSLQARLYIYKSLSRTRAYMRSLAAFPRPFPLLIRPDSILHATARRSFFPVFTNSRRNKIKVRLSIASGLLILGSGIVYLLPTREEYQHLDPKPSYCKPIETRVDKKLAEKQEDKGTAWFRFATKFEAFSNITDVEWTTLSDKIVGYIVPAWFKHIPAHVRKLQRELSMTPVSLADEIWNEAHDPFVHPEIQYSAKVRVSDDLCDEEKEFLARRKKVAAVALARYLGLEEKDVHADDVPIIAMCGSGGGLRALTAGAGAMLATEEDGLFDCVTYTSGVSGSCWLQALYNSSIANGSLAAVVEHLKARVGVHMAYPPAAFNSVLSAPTNKNLLSGLVEKLRGDPKADFGLVDIYGVLLAGRLLVPKGELGVNEKDFKLSNQRSFVQFGEHPLPIYTAVRHEIPDITVLPSKDKSPVSEEAKAKAKKESAWFQWYEFTPYEFFCEEFSAGIPTWALGRRFKDGVDVPAEHGFHLPETRMPFLLGIFGSAFCATLSHYYQEIRPLVRGLKIFGAIDDMVSQRNEDLSKVHPIDPGVIPNFVYGMADKLPISAPGNVTRNEYIQLMDAGMSNNLPVYPLMRRGRNVEIVITFDTSADVRTDNWLDVADGYARQRGVKGWPVGIGWPKDGEPHENVQKEEEMHKKKKKGELAGTVLADADRSDDARARNSSIAKTKQDQMDRRSKVAGGDKQVEMSNSTLNKHEEKKDGELGYCTVWVGTTTNTTATTTTSADQRTSSPPSLPRSQAIFSESDQRKISAPDAGIAVVYLPFVANPKVPGVEPGSSDYLSTWNFVYTPQQIDNVVNLARANYGEGKGQIRSTIRAVYDRKRRTREESERKAKQATYRRRMRMGMAHKLGEGDHFS